MGMVLAAKRREGRGGGGGGGGAVTRENLKGSDKEEVEEGQEEENVNDGEQGLRKATPPKEKEEASPVSTRRYKPAVYSVTPVQVDGGLMFFRSKSPTESQLEALQKLSESRRNLLRRDGSQRPILGPAVLQFEAAAAALSPTRIMNADVQQCAELMSLEERYKSWEPLSECEIRGHPIRIYRKMRPGSHLYDIYSHGTLPCTADQLVDVNVDIEYRLKWDPYAKAIRVVNHYLAQDSCVEQDLVYWEVAFPWPLSNRDYVFYRHSQVLPDGLRILISKGVAGGSGGLTDVAEVPGVVRVEELQSYFVIRPLEQGCEFALLYFDDLKGSIPKSIVNWAVSKAVPNFLLNLVSAIEKK